MLTADSDRGDGTCRWQGLVGQSVTGTAVLAIVTSTVIGPLSQRINCRTLLILGGLMRTRSAQANLPACQGKRSWSGVGARPSP